MLAEDAYPNAPQVAHLAELLAFGLATAALLVLLVDFASWETWAAS
jgi:hypothetical protein